MTWTWRSIKGIYMPWSQGMYQSSIRSNIAFSCCRPHDICIPVYNHPTSLYSFITHHTWISYMCYKWHPKWGHSSYVVKALCDKLTHCAIKCAWKPYHWTNQLDEEINTWPFRDLALSFQEGVAGWGPLIQKSQRHRTYLRRLLGTLTHDCMTTQLWIAALWHNYRFKFQLQL